MGTGQVYTVRKLLQDFKDGHLRQSRKPAGFDAAANMFDRILEDKPGFADKPADEVARADAFEVLESRKATRPAGFVYAQHRADGVYRRADWRDRLQRSRSSESAVTLPEPLRSPSPQRRSRSRNHRSR
jgi:hypothetical protein